MNSKGRALTKAQGVAKAGLQGNEAKSHLDMKASRITHKEKLYKLGGRMVNLKTLLESRKK